jgi:hypothetical protein
MLRHELTHADVTTYSLASSGTLARNDQENLLKLWKALKRLPSAAGCFVATTRTITQPTPQYIPDGLMSTETRNINLSLCHT